MPLALNVQTGDQQFENSKQIFNLSFTRPTSTWSSQIGVIKAWAIHIVSLCLPKFHMACCSDVSVNKPGSQCKRNKTYISRVSRDKQFQGSLYQKKKKNNFRGLIGNSDQPGRLDQHLSLPNLFFCMHHEPLRMYCNNHHLTGCIRDRK